MARIIIVLEDIGDNMVNYFTSCETPEETNENGEPTPALKLAVKIIDDFLTKETNNEVE